MTLLKQAKDHIRKRILGKDFRPRGLVEINQYFRLYDPINFEYTNESGFITAVSTNFRYGTIITEGKNEKELDENIKDAILTAFEIPSAYADEARVHKEGSIEKSYAIA